MIAPEVSEAIGGLLAERAQRQAHIVDLLDVDLSVGLGHVRDFVVGAMRFAPRVVALDELLDALEGDDLVIAVRRSTHDAQEAMKALLAVGNRLCSIVVDEARRQLMCRGVIDGTVELAQAPLLSSSLTVEIEDAAGNVFQRVGVTFPLRIPIHVPTHGGDLRVRVEPRAGFAVASRAVRFDARRARSVDITVDVSCGSAGDVLEVRSHVDVGMRCMLGAPARPASELPWNLHVLFDATTLDLERAYQTFRAPLAPEMTDLVTVAGVSPRPSPPAVAPNAEIRAMTSRALARALRGVPAGSRLSLYWFADRPREDGVRPTHGQVPSAEAVGVVGEQSLDAAGGLFCEGSFEYRPGLDLPDAVDEGLAVVVEGVRRGRRDERLVVCVVGDSPPPPSPAPTDPLWRLANAPRRVGTRVSTCLDRALADLRDRGAETVNYVFLRPVQPDVPADPAARAWIEQQDRVLTVLRQREGFHVVAADRTEAAISAAFDRAFHFRDVPRPIEPGAAP